jgi:hypothetical protein
MKKPTRYQVLQAALFFSGAAAVLLTLLLIEWTPPGILRAVALILCGANFSGIWYNWLLKAITEDNRRLRKCYDSLHDSFERLCEVNRVLIGNKFRVRVVPVQLVDGDGRDKPSVH